MPQIFHRSTNTIARATIFGVVLVLLGAVWLLLNFNRSDYMTGANNYIEQPVQFSHKHHVGDDGIDCRYCHTSVEKAASAGIPSTKICMNCHSQLWNTTEYLEPVRASWKTGKPIKWTRVHDLPDFVYFNHSIHVNNGVGCATCHGRVDHMPLVTQVSSLQMEWCLDCHRQPEKYLRPQSEVFNMAWEPPADQIEQGKRLAKEYNISTVDVLTSCSTCHR